MTENPVEQPESRRSWLWKGLITCLVWSVISLFFLQPILSLLHDQILEAIGIFYRGFIDTSYANAVVGAEISILFNIESAMLIIPLGILLGLWSAIGQRMKLKETLTEEKLASRRRKSKYKILISIICGFAASLGVLSGSYVSIQANATFQRRMMALAPVVTEDERKSLLRDWALVTSKDRYRELNDKMDNLSKHYNVTIPPPFI